MITGMINYLHVCSPIISLGVNVICQVCSCRYIIGFGLLKSIFVGFVLGMCSLVSIELYCLSQSSLPLSRHGYSMIVSIITYVALGYGYFHFINLGETARRIRILRELYSSKTGLSIEKILKRYSARDIFEKRIHRLLANGQILLKNGKYYIGSPIMLLISKIIVIMKMIIIGKRSEFD